MSRQKVTPTLIKTIVSHETPPGWTVSYGKGLTGVAWLPKRRLTIPALKHGYRTLWVYFHELAHALRWMERKFKPSIRGTGTSSHEEWIAETFAIEMMKRYGLPVLKKELDDAKRNVREYIAKEDAAGYPVDGGVRKWAQKRKRRR